jgi:hypothetical protein
MVIDYKTKKDATRYQFLREGGLSCLEYGLLENELVFSDGVDLDDEVDINIRHMDFVSDRSRDLETDAARYRFLSDGNICCLEYVSLDHGILDFYSFDALDQEVDNLILSNA